MTFKGWSFVAEALSDFANTPSTAGTGWSLDDSQRRSIRAIVARLPSNGLIIADEVGMGKTRIAVATVRAVLRAEGRVVILVPPGLDNQWRDELETGGVACSPMLRSLHQYLEAFSNNAQRFWDDERVVLLSHAFCNWRLRANPEPWRWALLPTLFVHWRKVRFNRMPRNSKNQDVIQDPRIHAAAVRITQRALRDGGYLAEFLDGLLQEQLWPGILDKSAYGRDGPYREALEGAVGLGLGMFDLIVIDEAHKNRGDQSGLTRLLDKVAVPSASARRIALTATPVELDATQWVDALRRIGADPDRTNGAIDAYLSACRKVQELPGSDERRRTFEGASLRFEAALAPFLVRRDKRESEMVRRFHALTGEPLHAYRRESAIWVEPERLDLRWRRAVCAAEALSIAAAGGRGAEAQRLRLTLGSGHGINEVLDRHQMDEEEDAHQLALDSRTQAEPSSKDYQPEAASESQSDKRKHRVDWWLSVLKESVASGEGHNAIMDHPGINAALQSIEDAHQKGEKVLVFGRYTKPMRALVSLLNAREMLLSLDAGRPWAQAVIQRDDEPAVRAAIRQLGLFRDEGLEGVSRRLAAQYDVLEESQKRLRVKLSKMLREGLDDEPRESILWKLFEEFGRHPEHLPVLARALTESLDPEKASAATWAAEFRHLVEATLERNEGDDNGDGVLDDAEAAQLWERVIERLSEEFGRREGGFARLMYGKTPRSTRRLLQLAFNRQNSFPRVLVVQSVVGREGLNLHRACRTVVLLHPEWNPGVVEQQIGRVDRLGSRWEQLLVEAEARSEFGVTEVPRIEVLPVIFKGTYDEYNWAVLRRRWNDLRAQLHGVVIPPSTHGDDPELSALAHDINRRAPNFSPG